MRTAVLVIAVVFIGCVKPQPAPNVSAVVIAPQPAGVPAVVAPVPDLVGEIAQAPMPREIRPIPHRASRMESHRNDPDPILRDLARGHIKAGDPIEPLIRLNPHYDVLRCADRVEMHYNPTGYGGTLLIGKDGVLHSAFTSSCMYRDVFIQATAEESWIPLHEAREVAWQKRMDAWKTLPALVGIPAAYLVGRRPPLAR